MIHSGVVITAEDTDRYAVSLFLREFKTYANETGISIFPRRNFLNTLADLGINRQDATERILQLTPQDYYKGLGPGHRENERICGFGTRIGEEEIYIKLLLNTESRRAICFSFHRAERGIEYPFTDDDS